MTIRVLVVDDDVLVRAGLRMVLETQPDLVVVGEAGDGDDGVRLTAELHPDVVLMDIRMPGMDGLEATRRITALPGGDDRLADATRAADDEVVKVVVLTTFELDDYVFEAVRAGASGFLLKRTPPEELIEGIRIVAAGDALLAPSVTRRLMTEFARVNVASPSAQERTSQDLARLTAREHEVLLLIARGLSNQEIASELFVGESTVKTHVKRILMKLALRDRVHAVVFAYQNALVEP